MDVEWTRFVCQRSFDVRTFASSFFSSAAAAGAAAAAAAANLDGSARYSFIWNTNTQRYERKGQQSTMNNQVIFFRICAIFISGFI